MSFLKTEKIMQPIPTLEEVSESYRSTTSYIAKLENEIAKISWKRQELKILYIWCAWPLPMGGCS